MAKSLFRRFTKKSLIFINLLFAFLFMLAIYNYLFNPSQFWFLGILNLGTFYLFLILLSFAFFWLFAKPVWALVSVLTFALSYKPLMQLLPLRIGSNFDKNKAENSIRIMSWNVAQFNILEAKKKPQIMESMMNIINENKPDISCFQEMVCGDSIINLNIPYYKKYYFYPIDTFVNRLNFPYHFYAYNPKEDFMMYQHFGIIIFSKYPIINKKTISFYPNDYNSIFEYADIVKDNDTLRLFNIHLQSLRFTPSNLKYLEQTKIESEIDIEQSKSVLSKLKKGFIKRQIQADRIELEIEKSPYPVMVCGDFNDVPNSYAYHKIGNNLQNAFEEKGSGIGRTFSAISPTLRIDNIFVDKKMNVLQYNRVAKLLSDHFPIIADVKLEKK